VRIALSEFAAALSADRDMALLAFIAGQIQRRTSRTISPDHLRSWLSTYPWFLVLDGLDEVPPSTNREDVLKIDDFWVDAAQANADVLVLATTRPQAYSDDFSPAYYRHLWLAPLSLKRAVTYADRLVKVRYAGELDRQQKILSRLGQALKQEATARLMRSPLQITIMAALVDQTGTPPQDRWRLFHDYYEVIYNRERERPIPAAELLRDYKPNIDAIHHQVGLILQVESERAGGTEAKLPADRFAALVTARLEGEGFSGPTLDKLRLRIIDAAANRLVFLVGLEAGQVGFEIRSLQEYMAAEAIMTGSQDKVQERLRRLAPIASWRNVFLFAAGRCFLQEQHLRDTIHTVCIELNDQLAGPVGRATLAGAVLALDLIEDGVARRQPKYDRLLAQCAVRLLDLPPGEIHGRLADVCEGEVEDVVRENLEEKLAIIGPETWAAWATLLALIRRGSHWTLKLADDFWPQDPRQQLDVLSLPTAERAGAWFQDRIDSVIRANSPREVQWLIRSVPVKSQRPWRFYELFYGLSYMRELQGRMIEVSYGGLGFGVTPISVAQEFASAVDLDGAKVHPGWLARIEDIRFSRSPSKQALAAGLRRIAVAEHAFDPILYYSPLFWVFGSCLAYADCPAEIVDLADRAARGGLGDLNDWRAAETRWKERALVEEDLFHISDDRWPFDRDIARVGFPVSGIDYYGRIRGDTDRIYDLLKRLNDRPRLQALLAPSLAFALSHSGSLPGPGSMSPDVVTALLLNSRRTSLPIEVAFLFSQWAIFDTRWLNALDEIGRRKSFFSYGFRDREEAGVGALVHLFAKHSDRVGILPLIVAAFRTPSIPFEPSGIPQVVFEHYEDPKIRS